jgi:thiol-disulfide isomerase/thioredoxin
MIRPMTKEIHQTPGRLPSAASLARRRWLFAAVAGLAALGGAGLAWRKYSLGPVDAGVDAHLWQASFDTPSGGVLAMSAFKGRPLVLNFWATWCPPCVEEFPLLDAFYKENSSNGWQVLGLAIDKPAAVRDFLVKLPVGFPTALAGLEGTELGKSLGNVAGGLPFTIVFASDGSVRHRKMGKLTPQDLHSWRDIE